MTFLARQETDALVPAVAMEGKVQVPANYRGKILNQLTRAGLLESTRGRTGGFRLSRPASRIPIAEVVAPFEPRFNGHSCILGGGTCSDSHPCAAHNRWRVLSRTRDEFLRETTVADVTSESIPV